MKKKKDSKAIKIGVGIQKGGTGKTMATGLFCNVLSEKGFKVLAVDLDSQGNLTEFLTRVEDIYTFGENTTFEAMKNYDATKYIVNINENLDILPSEDFLSFFPRWLYTEHDVKKTGISRRMVLHATLEPVLKNYDYIIMDFPPNLGDVCTNGMAAVNYMLIVAECARWCYHAVPRYLEMIDHIHEEGEAIIGKPFCRPLGIVRSLIDQRHTSDNFYFDLLQEEFPELILNSVIKRKARVKEFAMTGIKRNSKADREAVNMYAGIVKEVLARVRTDQKTD